MDAVIALVGLWVLLLAPFVMWSAAVADYRGRPPWLGAILAIAFGPLGVGAAWLLPPDRDVMTARRRDEELVIAAAVRWAQDQRGERAS